MLASPYTIIRRQKGNSFDYATLLCSLLLGAGYDAYVVSGYASREICNMDQSREICPLLKDDGEVSSPETSFAFSSCLLTILAKAIAYRYVNAT